MICVNSSHWAKCPNPNLHQWSSQQKHFKRLQVRAEEGAGASETLWSKLQRASVPGGCAGEFMLGRHSCAPPAGPAGHFIPIKTPVEQGEQGSALARSEHPGRTQAVHRLHCRHILPTGKGTTAFTHRLGKLASAM